MRMIWLVLIFGVPVGLLIHWGWDVLSRDLRNTTSRLIASLYFGLALRIFAIFVMQGLPLAAAPVINRFALVPLQLVVACLAVLVCFQILPPPYPHSPWQRLGYLLLLPGVLLTLSPAHIIPFTVADYVRQGIWIKPAMTALSREVMGLTIFIQSLVIVGIGWIRSKTPEPGARRRLAGLQWATLALAVGDAIFGLLIPDRHIAWLPPYAYLAGALGWLIAVRSTVDRHMVVPSRFERYRSAFERNPALMLLTKKSGQVIDASTAAVEAFGPLTHVADGFPLATRHADWHRLQQALSRDRPLTHWAQVMLDPDGHERATVIDGELLTLGDHRYWTLLVQDVTEWRQQQAIHERLAFSDALTDLDNAVGFHRKFDQLVTYQPATRLAVVFVDLDNFKTINDQWGHLIGNAVLAQVARRLRGLFGPEDAVCRFGGDEFVVLVQNPANEKIYDLLERLLQLFDAPFQTPTTPPLTLHASVGLSRFPEDGSTAEAVLARADDAMYQAKAAGKNQYRIFASEQTSDLGF